MYIATFDTPLTVSFAKSTGARLVSFGAKEEWVITHNQSERLAQTFGGPQFNLRLSLLETRLQGFRVANAAARSGQGRKLLFHAGAGGFGDQLLALPVARALALAGYEITSLVEPGNEPLWWHHSFVKLAGVPMKYAELAAYDDFALASYVTNFDCHPGQLHPVDNLLNRFGLGSDVADAAKVVAPIVLPGEVAAAERYAAGRQLAIYQLASSSPIRSVLPAASFALLRRLAATFPKLHWLALYDKHVAPAYKQLPDCPPNVTVVELQSLRHLLGLVAVAKIGVGPDSFFCHAFGSMGRPFVGLFGPVDPAVRIKYYTTVRAWWDKAACPIAPCYYLGTPPPWPAGCPGAATGGCAVINHPKMEDWAVENVGQLLEISGYKQLVDSK